MPATPNPMPTATPLPTEWRTLAPGLDYRALIEGDDLLSQLTIVRIDPALYEFRVAYRPGEALRLQAWRAELPEALILINANFFDTANQALGLLVADGVTYGQSYTRRGGLFSIRDGVPRIQSNVRERYQGEPLDQAVQAFPMLIENGAQT
ncbi:MAG: phosphodiester glycosidase family protein, partial [Armatimonadetes bacterium]|nr:phosphodiester glycosidase family protein [Anaerolineae bacterium]